MNEREERKRMEHAESYRRRFKSNKKTQKTMCLEYLEKYGSITPLEALNGFGSFRLSALIFNLRDEGYEIKTEINKGEKNFAIYHLAQ